jgi:hypothetical protein
MSASELLQRVKSLQVGSTLDWKAIRDEVAEKYNHASTADRITLLEIYQVVMDMAEKTISPLNLETFRTARRQDYNRMIISECIENGGDVSAEALKAVTDREVAASRMAPDDELRQLAAGGPSVFQDERARKGWRRAFTWKRKG